MHDMAVSVILKDGPVEKQSIGHVYKDKSSRKPSQTFPPEYHLSGNGQGIYTERQPPNIFSSS
jgi:hypothetical protein